MNTGDRPNLRTNRPWDFSGLCILGDARALDITEQSQVLAGAAKYKGWAAPQLKAA